MSNQFLVEIHEYITGCVGDIIREKTEAQTRGDKQRYAFLEGKATELIAVRKFSTQNFDLITQKYY